MVSAPSPLLDGVSGRGARKAPLCGLAAAGRRVDGMAGRERRKAPFLVVGTGRETALSGGCNGVGDTPCQDKPEGGARCYRAYLASRDKRRSQAMQGMVLRLVETEKGDDNGFSRRAQ